MNFPSGTREREEVRMGMRMGGSNGPLYNTQISFNCVPLFCYRKPKPIHLSLKRY